MTAGLKDGSFAIWKGPILDQSGKAEGLRVVQVANEWAEPRPWARRLPSRWARNRPARSADAWAMQHHHRPSTIAPAPADLEEDALQHASGGAKGSSEDSRAIEFESIKNDIQKLTQMQQALANIAKLMHEAAMSAIRHIKA